MRGLFTSKNISTCSITLQRGSETWTFALEKQRKIKVFEMYGVAKECLKISRTDMVTNEEVHWKEWLKEERYGIVSRKGETNGLDVY